MALAKKIEQWSKSNPDKIAIYFKNEQITFSQLWAEIERLSTSLIAELNIKCGDRVAFLGHNSPKFIFLFYALSRLGAILVPLNYRLSVVELNIILKDSEPKLLFFESKFQKLIDENLADGIDINLICFDDGKQKLNENLLKSQIELIEDNTEPVLLVYTSGTTGKPKGVLHSKSGILANIENSHDLHDFVQTDIINTVLPFFHVGGLCIQTLPALHMGSTVLLHSDFDPERWFDDLIKYKPTLFLAVPFVLASLIKHPRWKNAELSSLRLAVTGSSLVPEYLIKEFYKMGVPLVQVYGATETGPVSIYLKAEDCNKKIGSTGKNPRLGKIRILDSERNEVGVGEVGEIVISAPNLMLGYWKDNNNSEFQNGWFYSGDLGFMQEGYFYIVDRKKDMIISGGENIYSAEIENFLFSKCDLADSAAVGLPDPIWGEIIVLAVVKKPGVEIDKQMILDFFSSDKIAKYKKPKEIYFFDQLPKNSMGKTQKETLRQLILEKYKK